MIGTLDGPISSEVPPLSARHGAYSAGRFPPVANSENALTDGSRSEAKRYARMTGTWACLTHVMSPARRLLLYLHRNRLSFRRDHHHQTLVGFSLAGIARH